MSWPFTTGDLVSAADLNSIQAFQLATIDLTSVTEFTSIPQDYRDLQIRLIARSTVATATDLLRLRVNGSSAAGYFSHRWRLLDTSTLGDNETGATSARVAGITAASATADAFGSAIIEIPGYSSTDRRILGNSRSSALPSASVTTSWGEVIFGFGFNSTVAVTSITLFGSSGFAAGSRATLYGIGVL